MGKENSSVHDIPQTTETDVPACLERYLELVADESWATANRGRLVVIDNVGNLFGICDSYDDVHECIRGVTSEGFFVHEIGKPFEVVDAPNLLEIIEE